MLEGVKVLDLSRVLAGPYCTQLLADLGATVWKVEPPRGDETRAWGPPFVAGESAYFLSVNRNKEGLVVDLKLERGRELVLELASRADVFVENFKTGDLARYGLDYESVRQRNPGIVYASITGFGHDGPRAHRPGYDAAIQAMSGLMAMTGEPGGPPAKLGVAWVDVLAGLHAATGILAALLERSRTGVGQQLDIALFDVALASMVNQGQSALLTGKDPERLGSAHPNIVPYQAFPTATGDITIAVGNDRQFAALAHALAMPSLAFDERFATNEARVANRDQLIPLISGGLKERPRAEWLELLEAAGVPCGPVNTLPEALADEQVVARELLRQVEHPTAGTLPVIGSPFGKAARSTHEPPPLLGQHGRKVLAAELGLGESELAELERQGVIAVTG